MAELWEEKKAGKAEGEEEEAPSLIEEEKPEKPSELDLASLEAKLLSQIEGIRDGLANVLKTVTEKQDERMRALEERLAALEQRIAQAPPKTEEAEEEVLLGEEGRQARVASTAAKEVAEGLRSRGWSADDISKLMQGAGPFMQGLAALMQARQPQVVEDPFREAGRAMFTAFAEAMTKGVARTLGKRVGEETLKEEHE
ncbi:MAG: hypothetical protein QXP81_10885 [Nitrososphaerota archaeon]